MFIPTFDDDVGILMNDSIDFFHITSFDIMFFNKNKLLTIPVKLCHAVITLDMNVDWFVLFAVEEK